MVGMRFGIRSIGLISTIALARLLTPEDFGIVAMAMLLIGFIEVFGETGQQLALIRHPNPERAHFDSAWTMSIAIALFLGLVVFAVAPFATYYFHDPRIVPVVQVMSLRVFLTGFINIGVVNFRRDLDFAKDFRFGVLRKLLSFVVTLTLALLWRDYWALVVGTIVGHILEVGLSYIMHPYRPRFSLAKVRELWSYSTWLLVAHLGRFFQTRVDEIVVAGAVPPALLGKYSVAAEFGALSRTEILEPVARALFPNYARLAHDLDALRKTYLNVLATITAIAASAGTGLALVANDFVAVVLGPQWVGAGELMALFAVAAAVIGVSDTVFSVVSALGHSRLAAIQTWMRVLLYLPAMAWAATTHDLKNFAIAKLAVAVAITPAYFTALRRVLPMTWADLGRAVWRPICAAVVMAAVVGMLPWAELESALLRLIAMSAMGALVFVATQLALWRLSGQPDGLEAGLLRSLSARLHGIRGQTS